MAVRCGKREGCDFKVVVMRKKEYKFDRGRDVTLKVKVVSSLLLEAVCSDNKDQEGFSPWRRSPQCNTTPLADSK